ncbi:MAG: hypothetical protein JXA42_18830 [Anaerolineales bacterium]|nr:hypothetical protein [Anaerolineales bacterium]
MIRPFDLRDIPLLRRIEANGIILDSRTAYTQAHRPVRDALLAYLFTGRGIPTFMTSYSDLQGFGQIRMASCHRADSRRGRQKLVQAHLVAIGCYPPNQEKTAWPLMLEDLTAQAGRQGASALLAETDDGSDCFQYLRQADFTVYTRQEIWRLEKSLDELPPPLVRPERSQDHWAISQLVAKTEPILVQQVELERSGSGLVWEKDGQLLGYVCISPGSRGVWIELYVHPDGERMIPAVISDLTARTIPSRQAPLYCRVRRYQQWLNRPLAELGFEPVGTQAVMVRHILVRVAEMQLTPIPVSEKGLEATSPMVHNARKY